MISLLRRLFGRGEKPIRSRAPTPEEAFVVQVTPDEIINTRPDGTVEKVLLSELQAVIIETNDTGPWGYDVWWILVGSGKDGCVFPSGATGEQELMKVVQALPGFDNGTFIKAMASTRNERFLCWRAASEHGARGT